MRRLDAVGSLVFSLFLTGCPEDTPAPVPTPLPAATVASDVPAPGTPAASSGASDAPATTAAVAGEGEAAPLCQRQGEPRVWGKWVNARTGLTSTRLDGGKVVVGVAIGNHPHRLVLDENGEGTFSALRLAKGTELAKSIKDDGGERHLQRVTVTASGRAFADYRDRYESGRRRISCGPVDESPYLEFDGSPLLDVDTTGHKPTDKPTPLPPPPPGGASPAGSAPPADDAGAPVAPEVTATAEVPPPAAPPAAPEEQVVREIRDCRTFADASGTDVWTVGSELEGTLQDDGSRRWAMRFFVAPRGGRGRIEIYRQHFAKPPPKLYTLEAPVASRIDGGHVLAGRYGGNTMVWLLDEQKQVRSRASYGGGYPGLPRIAPDGDAYRMVIAQQIDPKRWKLSTLLLPGAGARLDKSLAPLEVGSESAAVPSFVRAGDNRWLAFHLDDRRRGALHVGRLDADGKLVGAPYAVTPDDKPIYESVLLPLAGGKLQLVYITRAEGNKPPELVTEILTCG